MGPHPGSTLISQENPYTTGPFDINPWSLDSPEVVLGDEKTKFPHLEMVVMSFSTLNLPSHRSISLLGVIDILLLVVL